MGGKKNRERPRRTWMKAVEEDLKLKQVENCRHRHGEEDVEGVHRAIWA